MWVGGAEGMQFATGVGYACGSTTANGTYEHFLFETLENERQRYICMYIYIVYIYIYMLIKDDVAHNYEHAQVPV